MVCPSRQKKLKLMEEEKNVVIKQSHHISAKRCQRCQFYSSFKCHNPPIQSTIKLTLVYNGYNFSYYKELEYTNFFVKERNIYHRRYTKEDDKFLDGFIHNQWGLISEIHHRSQFSIIKGLHTDSLYYNSTNRKW